MAFVYLTVEGNLEPALQITCKRKSGAIDLTGATVSLIIYNPKTKVITNTGHQECGIVDAANGVISYPPVDGDFEDPSIDYLAEVKIIHANTKPEIIYDQLVIESRPKLKAGV